MDDSRLILIAGTLQLKPFLFILFWCLFYVGISYPRNPTIRLQGTDLILINFLCRRTRRHTQR
jgi:hypothetical protein